MIPWTAILAVAGGLTDLALRIVALIEADGRCKVDGCPAAIPPAPLPDEAAEGREAYDDVVRMSLGMPPRSGR
jgi:hypothetical protein